MMNAWPRWDADADNAPVSHVSGDSHPLAAWVSNAPHGACLLDEDLCFVALNAAFAEIDVRLRDAQAGSPLADILPETPREVIALLRLALDTGAPTVEREIVVRQRGRSRYFVLSCFRVDVAPGRRGVGVALAEVTAQREAYERGEQAAERLRRLQDVASALSQVTTPDDVAAVILRQACDASGAAHGMVAALSEEGRTLERLALEGSADAAPQRIAADAPSALAAAFRTGAPVLLEWCALAAIPLVVSAEQRIGAFLLGFDEPRRLSDDERAFLVALGHQGAQALDRARLRAAKQRARMAAEEANRVKDEFLGVVSHELRTPLNAVLGWASLLHGKAPPGTLLDKGIHVIERNARTQAKIIDDILDVSRIVTGKLRVDLVPTDARAVLREAADAVRPAAESKGVELVIDAPDGLPDVAGDPDRLRQIFWNLLSNAVKFTPAGGRVEAAIGARDGVLTATVADTGAGIDAAFMPFVFERFRQADASSARRHGGLGLGLSIVRHMVELHGGHVSVESDGAGRGARFAVSLPLTSGRAPAIVRRGAPPEPESSRSRDLAVPPLDGLRVLVVDDEPDAREMIDAVLSDRGAVVEVAGSARAALDALAGFAPDVLLSDIGMPEEDGFSLLERVRALPSPLAGVPAVALTAFARAADAMRAADAGFAAHLPKPVEPLLLCAVLLSAAGRLPAG